MIWLLLETPLQASKIEAIISVRVLLVIVELNKPSLMLFYFGHVLYHCWLTSHSPILVSVASREDCFFCLNYVTARTEDC